MSELLNETIEPVYLKPEVKMEPLVCKWYAWPHLLAPVPLAMNINFRHLPRLQHFLKNSSQHLAASRDPKMYGGPYMSIGEGEVPKAQKLIDDTNQNCSELINLAKDIHTLNSSLHEKATGFSLNEFYAQLPPSLQGMVELTYDLNNRPNIRVFEKFLYDVDMTSHTQEIFLQPVGEQNRDFFMSTPRLETDSGLHLKITFTDMRLDALASMRHTPKPLPEVMGLFGLKGTEAEKLRSFFTPNPPTKKESRFYTGDDVRMRYFGHACVLFQTAETSILFDPFVAIEHHDDGRFTLNDLPDFIDYVVLTHAHQDHLCPEMLLQLRHRIGRVIVPANNTGNLADPSMKLILNSLGFRKVDVLDAFEDIEISGGRVVSLPFTGEHADLNIYSKHTIALTLKDRKFLFLVDSDGRDPAMYRRLLKSVGSVDAVFIGMECHGAPLTWLYEPLLGQPAKHRNNESRRLSGADCERAWSIISELKPPAVFVYAMGQEPWMNYIMGLKYQPDSIQLTESTKFIDKCLEAGIKAERLYCSREMEF